MAKVIRKSQPLGTPVRYPNKPGYSGFVDPEGNPYNDTFGMTQRRNQKGMRAYGQRRDFTAHVRQLVDQAGGVIQAEMATPQSVKAFIKTLQHGASIKVMDRTCIRLKAEILKLVSPEMVIDEFLRRLGVGTEGEAMQMVQAVRSAESADTLDGIERSTAYLEAALMVQPEQREMVIRRLGGLVPVPNAERV